jgi:pyruvate dehydrogenase E2 component (dihydrolipoamide acetyltransferase)
MEVPAPSAGTIQTVKVAVGDRISKGDLIATMEAADGVAQEAAPAAPAEPVAPAAAAAPALAPAAAQLASDEDKSPPPPSYTRRTPTALPPPVQLAGTAPPHASPSVRRFARELGADLRAVRGSGGKGRITRADVKAWVKGELSQPRGAAGGLAVAPQPEIDFSKFGSVDIQELTRIQKISGPHLQRAWVSIPHVTHHDEVDVTELEAFRQSLKPEAERQGARITGMLFIMKALVASLKEFPRLNASLTTDGQRLVFKQYYHIGIAVDTPRGLLVPVIRDVDKKGVWELAKEMGEISARARDGKLTPAEMQGGCISISNLGGIGGTAFTPIINAPEVAILGLSRSRMQPVWNGKEFEPRLMMPLDLSYDHRVIDGAEAARFVVHLRKMVDDVRRMVL